MRLVLPKMLVFGRVGPGSPKLFMSDVQLLRVVEG